MTRVLAPAGDVRTALGSVQRVLTYTAGGSVNWYKISGGTLAVYIKRLKKKIIPFHPVSLFLGTAYRYNQRLSQKSMSQNNYKKLETA